MDLSLHVATAAQRNLQQQLTIVANNIANAATPGFRAEIVDFESLVSKSSEGSVHYPKVAELYPSVQQGSLTKTDNPWDVAISGDGWFAISTPAGTAYTRDGRFMVSNVGELQTLEGHPVLDSGGAPVQLENTSSAPEFLEDGRILLNGRTIGNLGIYQIPAENFDSRFSNSAFLSTVPAVAVELGDDTKLNQGFVENSNVSAIHEMSNLILISKNYESIASMIGRVDDTLGRSVRELGSP